MRLILTTLASAVLLIFSQGAYAQLASSTAITYNPISPTSCTSTSAVVDITESCSNMTFVSSTVTVGTTDVTIDLEYTIGPICLGAIRTATRPATLGILPSTINTVTVNCLVNGTTAHTANYPISVLTCCPVSADFSIPQSICPGDTVILQNTTQNALNYRWYLGGTLLDTTQDLSYAFANPGTYQINLAASDSSCSDSISKNVFVINSTVDLGPDTTVCTDGTFSLAVSNQRDSVRWSTGASTISIPITAVGTYWIRSYQNGCEARDTVLITAKQSAAVDLGSDTTICLGDSLMLEASDPNNVSYVWQDGSMGSSFKVTGPGTYYVRATSNDGCVASDTIEVMIDSCDVSLLENNRLNLRLYPVPVNSILEIKSPSSEPMGYTILNVQGVGIHSGVLQFESGSAQLNVTELPTGTYLLQVRGARSVDTYRFIKQQ